MSMKHQALYGLKYNPFSPEIPVEGCLMTEGVVRFYERVKRLAQTGGFALISGESGTGKSVALRILCARLKALRDMEVRELSRPQCSVADFYRELGALFDVPLTPHNRWAGAKVLREQWQAHIESSLSRVVLVIDEAQEMNVAVLNELRLLTAAQLDSRSLLSVVLAGDDRLPARFNTQALAPLGTRIRVRLRLKPVEPGQLAACLSHVIREAGHADLMTEGLIKTLSEHSGGNLRVMMNLADELFEEALHRELKRLDEELYFDVFTPVGATPAAKASNRRKRA